MTPDWSKMPSALDTTESGAPKPAVSPLENSSNFSWSTAPIANMTTNRQNSSVTMSA